MKTLLLLISLFAVLSCYSQDITTGLVAYYPFDGNSNDASANGNNGIQTNTTLAADHLGNPNNAFSFNGNAWIRVPNSASLNVGSQITMAAYVKVQGFYLGPCHGNAMFDKGDNDNVSGLTILRFDDGFFTHMSNCANSTVDQAHENFYANNAEPPANATIPYINTNQWYCVVYTFDGSTAKLYMDGNLVVSNASSPLTFNNPYDLFIGRKNSSSFPYWFTGVLDEMRIYNRALTALDVSALCGCVIPTINTQPINASICANTNTSFTISATNASTYQWQVNTGSGFTNIANNGIYSGATTNTLTLTGATASMNNFQYQVIISTPCSLVASLTATLTVNPTVTPTVSISTPANPICSGTTATFTATPLNGGTTPGYQWKKNGINVGVNGNMFSDNTLNNGDVITVTLTSNAPCLTSPTATSNGITMIVNPSSIPTVTATPSANNICPGTPITFTATSTNGGSAPIYQWIKNGINVGTNSTTYTDNSLSNGDIIKVSLTSNLNCAIPPTVTSVAITIQVNPVVTPSVSITSSANPVCSGLPVTFTAVPISGGPSPDYQWIKNGSNVGNNSATYIDNAPINNEVIQVTITSNAPCQTTSTASSNSIVELVSPSVTPSVTVTAAPAIICSGTPVQFTATPVNGGSQPLYQWTKNGVNVGSNSNSFTDNTLVAGDIVKVTLTSNALCATTATISSIAPAVQVTRVLQNLRYPAVNANIQPAQLQARFIANASYAWDPVTGLDNALISSPLFSNAGQIEYKIHITYGPGCETVDTQLVYVFRQKDIYVPRAFSPNGDGKNDKLYPILVGIKQLDFFRVYNRWGNLLFETNSSSPSNGWDGTFNGASQPIETYTWVAQGIDIDGVILKRSGNTLLIR